MVLNFTKCLVMRIVDLAVPKSNAGSLDYALAYKKVETTGKVYGAWIGQ